MWLVDDEIVFCGLLLVVGVVAGAAGRLIAELSPRSRS
jgi:hypothetical protein